MRTRWRRREPAGSGLRINIHASAGLQNVDDDKAYDERERRHHLEIDQRLDADATDSLEVLHSSDTMNDGAEDDRGDQHFDHLDEGIAKRFHLLAELRIEVAQEDAEDDRRQHLGVEM